MLLFNLLDTYAYISNYISLFYYKLDNLSHLTNQVTIKGNKTSLSAYSSLKIPCIMYYKRICIISLDDGLGGQIFLCIKRGYTLQEVYIKRGSTVPSCRSASKLGVMGIIIHSVIHSSFEELSQRMIIGYIVKYHNIYL